MEEQKQNDSQIAGSKSPRDEGHGDLDLILTPIEVPPRQKERVTEKEAQTPDSIVDNPEKKDLNQAKPVDKGVKLLDLQRKEEQIMRKFNGIFHSHDQTYVFSTTSLFCLSDENLLRKGLVWLITWNLFEYFCTIAIILNSLLLASTDYGKRLNTQYESEWTPTQEKMDMVFTYIFLFEAICKIVGMGFALHEKAYLSESWNCLDFFIVCISVITLVPLGGNQDAFKSLRTFRILRPLRSINKMPKMRLQIQSLFESIPGLLRVFFFIIFIFTIFSIFGTITFNGLQYQFCRATEEADYDTDSNFLEWRKLGADEDGPVLCEYDSDCAAAFPGAEVALCGTVYKKYGLDPIQYDNIRNIELIQYGIPGFDNVFQAFLTIFQILTLESWVYLMYNYSDTGSSAISIIFFVMVVIIGAFFTMNLILAIIIDAFNQSQEKQDKKDKQNEQEQVDQVSEKNQTEQDNTPRAYTAPNEESTPVKKVFDIEINQLYTISTSTEGKIHTEYEEEWFERDARSRSYEKGKYVRFLYKLVTSVSFNFFIFLLILANTATLAAYTYDQSEQKEQVLARFNNFFTWIFFIEMVFKMIGLGFYNYRQDSYNCFDAVIVSLSLLDWSLSLVPNLDLGPVLRALRALRLLRMLKLAKSWTALAEILRKTGQSLIDISNFSLLLLLFMYIFALLGMELFSNTAMIDADDNLVMGQNYIQELYLSDEYYVYPRDNFNSIGYALTTVFISIIGEDWNWTMYQWVRAYGNGSSVSTNIALFYFLTLMVLGNIVLFSLFTAILLRNFQDDSNYADEEKEEEESDDNQKPSASIFSKEGRAELFEGFQCAFGKKKIKLQTIDGIRLDEEQKDLGESSAHLQDSDSDLGEDGITELQEREQRKAAKEKIEKQRQQRYDKASSLIHYDVHSSDAVAFKDQSPDVREKFIEKIPAPKGQSLWCLSPTNCFRILCYKLSNQSWFQNFILAAIIISTITLAFDSPLKDPKSEQVVRLGYIDLTMTIIFTFEVTIKIISLGFYLNGPGSFILDGWNILDFIIVSSALLSTALGSSVPFLKALRILRVLRPLRVISRNKGLKVAIISLGRSIPNIFRLQVIVVFFVFLFAVLNTTLFSGQFYYCSTDHLSLGAKQSNQSINTMWDCYNYGGEWIKPDLNFDTTMTSLLTLVTIQSTEGWIDVMWSTVDSTNPYFQPIENNNPFMTVYFMILVIIICMLFIELFVGIIIETFSKQKEFISGNRSLHRIQRSWIEIHMMSMNAEPKVKFTYRDHSNIRGFCIQLTDHKHFDTFIMFCIMGNTLVLALNWYMQSEVFVQVLDIFNTIFLIVFSLEAIIKIIALKLLYFKDSWNVFDFTIVVVSLTIIAIVAAMDTEDLAILGILLRSMRTFRIFRLVKKQEKLLEIFKTLLNASPAMGSLGVLLMLLIFMFSIIGMSLFALVNLDGASEMGPHVNFQTFGGSFLTLMRCATGEAWNSIMFDSRQSHSIMYQCNEDEDYNSIVEDGRDPTDTYGPQGCGSSAAIGFHLLFQIIVSQIFLNLFIAIIIDAFFGQTDLSQLPVQEKTIEDFVRYWSMYDKQASGYITIEQFYDLLLNLAKADEEEGGALIVEKKKIIADEAYLQRYLSILEIPTYESMQKVMFYDVLMKLVHRAIQRYYKKDQIEEIRRANLVIQKMGRSGLVGDELEAYNQGNIKKLHEYDLQFVDLLKKLDLKNPRAELIRELRFQNENLKDQYNHLVDTNVKIIGQEKFAQMQDETPIPIEVYTTKHLGSAIQIYELIESCIERKEARNRKTIDDGLEKKYFGQDDQ